MIDKPHEFYQFVLGVINEHNLKKKAKTSQDSKDEVSLKLKAYRASNDLTIEELAKKLGVTRMQVMRWEARKNRPSPLALQKMKEIGI